MRRALIFLGFAATALAADPVQLSLKRAVEIATAPEGSAQIQTAAEAVNIAKARQQQTRADLLPNVDGSFTVQNETVNLQALGLRLASPIPGFTLPDFVGPFTIVDARLNGTQTIFNFSSIRRLQAARVGTTAAKSDLDNSGETVAAQVARAYLAALRADADVEAALADITLSEAVLKQSENQKAAGTGTGIEITRAKVQLANDRQRLIAALNTRRGARLQLLRIMNMRMDVDLALTDKLEYKATDVATVEQARALALKDRPDLRAQQEREQNARLSASAVKLERLPSLAAFGNYGSIGTSVFNSVPTRSVGIAVSVPIFDGGRREGRRAEASAKFRTERVKTNDLKEQIDLDVRLALDNLTSATDQVKVATEGLELAGNEVAQARRRFDAGVAAGLEVTDAQTRLTRARENSIAALYAYNLAQLDLAQATGRVRNWVQ